MIWLPYLYCVMFYDISRFGKLALQKKVEFAMKTLFSLASHIWYYKVTVTIFLKKNVYLHGKG